MRNFVNTKEIFSKKLVLFGLLFITLSAFVLISCDSSSSTRDGKIVVANRADGTITVINVETDTVESTVPLPAGPNQPEPMYVFYIESQDLVFVDDRANNRVVAFDADDYSVVTTIPIGNGGFHMWGDDSEGQLWVNNDIDNTVTVINTNTLEVITTIPIPQDLVDSSGIPHDVILDPVNPTAFVSVIGVLDGEEEVPDVVVKFSTETFEELDRVDVGLDPHLSLAAQNNFLYVPCQGTNNVFILNRDTLDQVIPPLSVPGAHGAGMTPNGQRFYTTNISGGGTDGLFAIETATNTIAGSSNTPFPTPHNIAVNGDGTKLYVTQSGADADQVTVYTVSDGSPVPVFSSTVIAGLNPFGIGFVE